SEIHARDETRIAIDARLPCRTGPPSACRHGAEINRPDPEVSHERGRGGGSPDENIDANQRARCQFRARRLLEEVRRRGVQIARKEVTFLDVCLGNALGALSLNPQRLSPCTML